MFPTILIVDDEPSIRNSLGGLLTDEGFKVLIAANGYEALKLIESELPDLVLLDIWMPGIDGLETLKEIKKENPSLPVVMITGHGTIETAVDSTKIGAYDFIEKPLSIDKVIVAINNALNFRRLEEENKYLRKRTIEKNSLDGNSHKVQELKKQIMVNAPSEASILIYGENGTGKELVARSIHQFGSRASWPLISVNCATVQDDLFESELFGHEKGAFTGATAKNKGYFELASEGTIFLDEIGDMSIKNQGKLLKVLEEQKFRRVGGNRVLKVNVRIITATNKDLEEEIKKGNFREDLYFRLNVVPIMVPPLRERIDDIPSLVKTFIKKSAKRARMPEKDISNEAIELLKEYPWPGNIRELKNLVERLLINVEGNFIDTDNIPVHYIVNKIDEKEILADSLFSIEGFKPALQGFEKEFIKKKLEDSENDIKKAAKVMGINTKALKKKIKSLKIDIKSTD